MKLLTPARRGWTRWLRRMPLTGLLAIAIIPNVFLSVFNVLYNLNVSVGEEHLELFHRQVGIVNAVAFSIGIALMVRIVWPIAKAMRALSRRVGMYFAACTAVPFLAVIILASIDTDLKMAFLWLGVIGAIGFGVSLWLQGEIRKDLDALSRTLKP